MNWYLLLLCSGLCSIFLCFLRRHHLVVSAVSNLSFGRCVHVGVCLCVNVTLCGHRKLQFYEWLLPSERGDQRGRECMSKNELFKWKFTMSSYGYIVLDGSYVCAKCVFVCVFVCENVPTGSEWSLHLRFDLFCKSLTFDLNHPNTLLSGSISCLSWYLRHFLLWMNVFILAHKLPASLSLFSVSFLHLSETVQRLVSECTR